MKLNPKEALISAFVAANKPVAFLVGAPLSSGPQGKGVPNVTQILDIAREVVQERNPISASQFENEIHGKLGADAYQLAMGWLQAYISQDAVNSVVRKAVLKSCFDTSSIGNPDNPSGDGEPGHWYIPEGTESLASLVCGLDKRLHGPILTPNFDPLLSLAIKSAGKIPSRRTLDVDGSLPRDIDNDADARNIVHFIAVPQFD